MEKIGFLGQYDEKEESMSDRWAQQKQFHQSMGFEPWSKFKVPRAATNSPFLAKRHAILALKYYLSLYEKDQLSPEHPIWFVELGGGGGVFSFLFFREFLSAIQGTDLASFDWRYLLTDLSEKAVTGLKEKHFFYSLLQNKRLAIYPCDVDTLTSDMQTVEKGVGAPLFKNPTFWFCNYLFCSLPQESFLAGDDLVEVDMDGAVGATAQSVQTPKYTNPILNAALHQRSQLRAGHFLYPKGGIAVIESIKKLTNGRAAILISDMAPPLNQEGKPEGMRVYQAPPFEFYSVDFESLACAADAMDGVCYLPKWLQPRLTVALCAFGAQEPLEEVFNGVYGQFGPADLWNEVELFLERDESDPARIARLIRLSDFDPEITRLFMPTLQQQRTHTNFHPYEWAEIVERTANCWLPLTNDDAHFWIELAKIAIFAKAGETALVALKYAMAYLGESAKVLFYLGLCYHSLGDEKTAAVCLIKAEKLDPSWSLDTRGLFS